MIKKIINLSLIAILSLQTVQAGSILDNALSNYTPANSITIKDNQGNDVKSMYYSGGYYFRFMGGTNPQPVWSFSPPEIQAGCNGLNMKGMFVSLLGLDQFGSMLQNAGASLAWGIAIGLVYSLPGVGNVFKILNQWAHDLQKLLGMSCQAGIAIGEALANKTGLDAKKGDDLLISNQTADSLAHGLQGGIKSGIQSMGLTNIDFDWDNGFDYIGGTKHTDSQVHDRIAVPLAHIFADVSLGGSILNDYVLSSVGADFRSKVSGMIDEYYKESKNPICLKKLLINYQSSYDLSGQTGYDMVVGFDTLSATAQPYSSTLISKETKEGLGLKFLSYSLFYNLYGDIGYDLNKLDVKLKEFADAYSKSSKGTEGKTEGDKKVIEFIYEGTHEFKDGLTTVGSNIIPDDTVIKNFILNGSDTGEKSFKPLYAPTFGILGMKEAQTNETNFMIVPVQNNTSTLLFPSGTSYIGVENMSKCIIYNSLKEKLQESSIESLKKQSNNSELNCETYKFLKIARMDNYSNILANSALNDRQDGIEHLKQFYTKILARSIIDQMLSNLYVTKLGSTKVKENKATPGKNDVPKGSTSGSNNFSTALGRSEVSGKIEKFRLLLTELKKDIKLNGSEMNEVVEVFNKLNDKNKVKVNMTQQ